MSITIKLGLGAAAIALLGVSSFPPAAQAQSRIRFTDSGQRLGSNYFSVDVALGDVNGDGTLDAVVARDQGTHSQVWTNQGGGILSDSGQSLASSRSRSVALADLDGDGDLDAFFIDEHRLDFGTGAIQVWTNHGGVFRHNGQFIGDTASEAAALGPLDARSGVDAFVVRNFQTNKVWFNRGDGQFRVSDQQLASASGLDVGLADLDGHGYLDAFVVNHVDAHTVWFNQNGDSAGTFSDSGQRLNNTGAFATSVALGDLDGDGDVDAFVVGTTNRVWINRGGLQGGSRGNFTNSAQIFPRLEGEAADHVVLGDLDHDGDLDAIVATVGLTNSTGRVYENDGAGRFTDTGVRVSAVANYDGRITAVALGDLDGDGDLDAFVAIDNEPNQVWLNTTPPLPPTFPEYVITTIAGNGSPGADGDGGPATNAQISGPWDVAVDASGNLFIAEYGHQPAGGTFPLFGHRVRKLGTNEIITTFAGTGVAGFSGDGGPATEARLSRVLGVAVDRAGNVYLADVGNNRIRRVDTNGIITTFAGSAMRGFSGDGGPATNAWLSGPQDVAVDNEGNVYIADTGNYRIRRVGTNGMIATVAGNGTNGFSGDNGPATEAELEYVASLTTDRGGNLYFSHVSLEEPFHDRIRRVAANGVVTTVAGTSIGYSGNGDPATAALLRVPTGVAVDAAGNLFIADVYNHRIRWVGANGLMATIAGTGAEGFSGDGGAAHEASLQSLNGLAVDAAGNVFVTTSNRVRRLRPTGKTLPLVPKLRSMPSRGDLIDFSYVSFVSPSNSLPGLPETRSLLIWNEGAANLKIQSISFVSGAASLLSSFATNAFANMAPNTIRDGYNGFGNATRDGLGVTITLHPTNVTAAGTMLRIVSNDPDLPVADYPVYFEIGDPAASGIVERLIAVMTFGSVTPSPVQQARLTPDEIQTAILHLDPKAPHTLTSEVPAFLGGGSVVLSNFSGSLTVTVHPIPNDFERAYLTIDGGSFTAPSVQLPAGLHTGLNTLTFGPASQSEGFLNLSNGQYSVTAAAIIVNDLTPEGVRVRGNYSGIYDEKTGLASVQSESTDSFVRSERVQVSQSSGGIQLTWSGGSALEEATEILGPWRTVTNAASPYAVVTTTNQQQFFRLRLPGP